MTGVMENIVYQYLDNAYSIDFICLEDLSKTPIQKDKILKPFLGGENTQLGEMIPELEMLFDINRSEAFWSMHDWLIKAVGDHIENGGKEEVEKNLRYLLGWFNQMRERKKS